MILADTVGADANSPLQAGAAWRTLKQRDPEALSPYFMSAFTLEALGRYPEAAAEWRYIISWLEEHDDAVHTTWPKEMLEGIEAKNRCSRRPRTSG